MGAPLSIHVPLGTHNIKTFQQIERRNPMNKLIISGNVTAAPIVRTVKIKDVDTKVANFTLAVNDPRRKDAPATYFRVAAWRGLADTVEQFVYKGRRLMVEGPVTMKAYVGQNGQARYNLEVSAKEIEFEGANAQKTGDAEAPAEEEAAPEYEDTDFPF